MRRYRVSHVALMLSTMMLAAACATGVSDNSEASGEATERVESRSYIFVQAHRGSTTDYPELTMAAIESALDSGVDRIELDLAVTSDDHVVVMHDATIDRTTDGSGRVESMTLEDIKALDAGSWHSSAYIGETVPTLREILERVAGEAELNLEIKTSDRPSRLVDRVVRETVALVTEFDADDWVVYSSFDIQALQAVRALNPDARLLLIDWRPASRFDGLDLAIAEDLYAWSPSQEHISFERVQRARREGLVVHVGAPANDRALRYVDWGVDGLSSGNPQELVRFLEANGFRDTQHEAR